VNRDATTSAGMASAASRLEGESDETLAACIGQGDARAFQVLMERHINMHLSFAERMMGTREEAEDIVQEVFTKIYLNAARFRSVPGASFKSWGYKILLNTTFTSYKKLRKEDIVVKVEQEIHEMFPDTKQTKDIKTGELNDYIASILSKMPTHLSRVLSLHFLEDKPHKEIAEMEGVSVSAIKTRIHRAKKEFKKIEPNLVL